MSKEMIFHASFIVILLGLIGTSAYLGLRSSSKEITSEQTIKEKQTESSLIQSDQEEAIALQQ